MSRARIELLVWLGLAALAFALTFEFSGEPGTYAWGAASWPRGVILLLALFALLHYAGLAPAADGPEQPRDGALGRRTGALLLPLAYAYLIPRAGFYATTPLFVALYLLLLGERRPVVLVSVPLLVFALVSLVFVMLFYTALPTGTWSGFYELSNAFLGLVR
jgi:hypothetical protein